MDRDDFSLSLDSLFFENPVVHEVKPHLQEASLWQLKAPPSLSHIPAIQDIKEEAESLSVLSGFSEKPTMFQPPFKRSDGLKVSSKVNSSYYFYKAESVIKESRHDGCQEGPGFRDYPQGGFQGARGETLQDPSHTPINTILPPACDKSSVLRRSLFKTSELTSSGDPSTKDDTSNSRRPTSTSQTFLGQVAMTTAPLALQLPQATVGHTVPPFPSYPALSPPPPCSRHPQHAEMQDRGPKRALVPPMTPQPLHIQGSSGSDVLRPVSEIPSKFRSIFSQFPFFNCVQSKALDDVLYTSKNFVVCAPTGSGKTVLLELAIIRLLMETPEPWTDVKAVYIAPIKALCSQCFENWTKKFGPLGLNCKELTGDTEIDDFFEIHHSHIILTTPEKWDSMTRKWKDNCLLQLVRLFLIDEVHVVKDAVRGATLEVVVSRMKAVQVYRASQNPEAGLSMRFVAVSATIPNISDIADWLSDETGPAIFLNMDESHRPVKLRKVVLGFPCSPNQSEFKFDLSLNYKMANIIQTYSEQKPALVIIEQESGYCQHPYSEKVQCFLCVHRNTKLALCGDTGWELCEVRYIGDMFCSTRKGAQQSAAVLAKDARFIMSIEHKQRLIKYANTVLDSKLRDLLMLGVGYHHAGVGSSDRKMVEEAFILGDLPVLFTTRTLAMGVNLPAHLVVIKSTMHYSAGSCEEYSEGDLLQMIGRAGRPQFDTSATAVIMTKHQSRDKYMKLMNGMETIESSLHSHLVEHLNAEIVLHTINDVNMALDWIRSTFLYIRALKKPTHYGFSADLDRCGIEAKLQELCLKNLNSLSSIDLITMDEDINIKATEAGRLMARYCVAFDTMKQFSQVSGSESLADLVALVSRSREFRDIQLRVNERRPLNSLNRDKNRTTIRFPLEGKIRSSEMKVNCLIQAQLGSISIQDFGLTQDTAKIFRNGLRIIKCLSEFLSQRSDAVFSALLNSVILVKCFKAKLWENSPYVSKQLEKIGQTLSAALVNAGLTSFIQIEQTNARELELIVNRHPPFGNQIRESVMHLPKYEVTLEQLPRYSSTSAEIVVKVTLKNQSQLLSRRTAPDHHWVSLIVGNSDNAVVFLHKLKDSLLLKCGCWSKRIDVEKASKGHEISVNLISSEYVGLDVQQKFMVFYSASRTFENPNVVPDIHAEQKAPQSALKPPAPAETQTEDSSSARIQDPGYKRQCNHLCKKKSLCAHDCCKVGVTLGQKRLANRESSFSSYLKDLRNRSDALVQTPVKRLKMKMNEDAWSVSMQRFASQPKDVLPHAWCEGNESVLTTADCPQIQDVVCLNDPGQVSFPYYEEDEPKLLAASAQTSSASHVYHQRNLTSGVPKGLGSGQCWKQINLSRTHPEESMVAAGQGPLQIPAISFDLGDEWEDWEDFDDQNMLQASESQSSERRIQQRDESSMSGYRPASAPKYQTEPSRAAVTTPLRPVSETLDPKLGPSPVNQAFMSKRRITLDWNKKRPNIFSDEMRVNSPEKLPDQLTKGLDFFYTMTSGAGSSPSRSSREEEAFLGIFDGIF